VSAVPIVDDNNVLVATVHILLTKISEKDIRVITDSDEFPKGLYNQTCMEFAQKIHKTRHDSPAFNAVKVNKDSTMKQVLATLFGLKIHRVWVVNEDGNVISIVSLKDVLAEMLYG
jgi:CBS-domain-containing membrane protein